MGLAQHRKAQWELRWFWSPIWGFFFFFLNVFELTARAAVKEKGKPCGFIPSDPGRIWADSRITDSSTHLWWSGSCENVAAKKVFWLISWTFLPLQVMKCIVEALADVLSRPHPVPVSQECLVTLKTGKTFTWGRSAEGDQLREISYLYRYFKCDHVCIILGSTVNAFLEYLWYLFYI